jgi:hypothetical protein
MALVSRALHALEDGRVIKRIVAVALRLAAILSALAALLVAFVVARLAPEAIIASLPLVVFYLLSTACQIQILLYRAKSILALPGSRYAIIPVVSLLLRGAGECIAASSFLLGLGAALAIWISKQNPQGIPSITAGAAVLIGSLFLGFAAFIAFYFLAELSLVAMDVSINLSRPTAPPASSTYSLCPACQFEVPSAEKSCPICGTEVH